MPGRLALAALVLALRGAHGPAAEEFARVELPTPRPAGRGQAVELQVTTGPLPRGSRLVLSTEAGEVIGAVAPFPPGAGTRATVPVPQAASAGGMVRLRVQVAGPGTPPRAPRTGEVTRLELVPVQGE